MQLHIPARYLHFGLIAVLCLTVYACQSKLPAAAVPCDYKLYYG